jgi:transposase
MGKGIRFTDEFKRDALAQVVERGYAVSEAAGRLGISTKLLYSWKAQFSKPPPVRAEVLDQAAEIRRLKRELARVIDDSYSTKGREPQGREGGHCLTAGASLAIRLRNGHRPTKSVGIRETLKYVECHLKSYGIIVHRGVFAACQVGQ